MLAHGERQAVVPPDLAQLSAKHPLLPARLEGREAAWRETPSWPSIAAQEAPPWRALVMAAVRVRSAWSHPAGALYARIPR